MFKIFLNKNKSKLSVNKENNINISLDNNNKILPLENIVGTVNGYEQYIKEKKESQTYRLSFNITPICSNVLFNKISEIVYHEGGSDCVVFNKNGISGNNEKLNNSSLNDYCVYKGFKLNELCRSELIKDTGFSHSKCGALVYHCGYDIFNNHTLRKREFNVVNKLSDASNNKKIFNTLYDLKRDYSGNEIINYKNDLEHGEDKIEFYEHLYIHDNVYTFEESINQNLIEKNGWIGFINPNGLNIANYKDISLNKCMNNNKACEMIDMYPDRSLFSFIPKINKYRDNRLEKNWDYCLTYPYKNFYDNSLVQKICDNGEKINGLQAFVVNNIFDDDLVNIEEGGLITLKTLIKNGFNINSVINIVLIGVNDKGEEVIVSLENNEKIVNVGYEGKHNEYYFSIYADELIEKLYTFNDPSKVDIRVRRVNDGGICEYYFRYFRRIPKLTHVNNFSEEDIKVNSNKDFNSTINGLGFSRTIYNDRNAQLLFNDDINLKNLKDNLGRDISEIYLTLVKNNCGNKEWYIDKNYTNDSITNSRCFGKITSGINILDDNVSDFNIHKIHNVSPEIMHYGENEEMWKSIAELNYEKLFKKVYDENNSVSYILPEVLEDDINIYGTVQNDVRNNLFLGDIIEFNKYAIKENVLEEVLHRFNTVQREILDEEYRDLIINEIGYDDYDLKSEFSQVTKIFNEIKNSNGVTQIPINIDPEGYYYKPHHKIILKKYKDIIKQGSHTKVVYKDFTIVEGNNYQITTTKNYYFQLLDEIYFYHKLSKVLVVGKVLGFDNKERTQLLVNVKLPTGILSDYILYKPNSEKPYGAYELNDGSGRYLWRDLLEDYEYENNDEISKYVFTNNAHYINRNIIFTLHRQDPDGKYNLSNTTTHTPILNSLSVEGVINDYSDFITMISEIKEGGLLC